MAVKPVLILGIGNILLRDEGLGVRTVESMTKMDLPDNIELIDGGTAGAGLIDIIADRKKIIIIDCMNAKTSPGTISRLTIDDLADNSEDMLSLHEFGLLEALKIAEQLNCSPEEVIVFGIQPESITPGLELSEKIKAAIPVVIEMISDEING